MNNLEISGSVELNIQRWVVVKQLATLIEVYGDKLPDGSFQNYLRALEDHARQAANAQKETVEPAEK